MGGGLQIIVLTAFYGVSKYKLIKCRVNTGGVK